MAQGTILELQAEVQAAQMEAAAAREAAETHQSALQGAHWEIEELKGALRALREWQADLLALHAAQRVARQAAWGGEAGAVVAAAVDLHGVSGAQHHPTVQPATQEITPAPSAGEAGAAQQAQEGLAALRPAAHVAQHAQQLAGAGAARPAAATSQQARQEAGAVRSPEAAAAAAEHAQHAKQGAPTQLAEGAEHRDRQETRQSSSPVHPGAVATQVEGGGREVTRRQTAQRAQLVQQVAMVAQQARHVAAAQRAQHPHHGVLTAQRAQREQGSGAQRAQQGQQGAAAAQQAQRAQQKVQQKVPTGPQQVLTAAGSHARERGAAPGTLLSRRATGAAGRSALEKGAPGCWAAAAGAAGAAQPCGWRHCGTPGVSCPYCSGALLCQRVGSFGVGGFTRRGTK